MAEMTIERKIQLFETAISAAGNDKNKAEAEQGVLENQLNNLYAKSRELGVEPDKLGEEIKTIRDQVGTYFDQIYNLVPKEYLAKVGL